MKKISFKVITLFPDLIQSYLKDALLSKAIENKLIDVSVTDLRKFSQNKYNSVDDTVFGGSDGMLLQYRPLAEALKSLGIAKKNNSTKKVVYLSPQGKTWTHKLAKSWSDFEEVILICGRYAGIDQRVLHLYVDEEISMGDFVLSGGELAALTIIESTSRYIPGVLGHALSAGLDSFEDSLLEAPQFSKPQVEDDLAVPSVLLSGNHQKISDWRDQCAVLITLKKRPDLLAQKKVDWSYAKTFYQNMPENEKILLDLVGLEFPK